MFVNSDVIQKQQSLIRRFEHVGRYLAHVNHCSKPGCAQVGGAVLTYDYDARLAFLDDPIDEQVSPHAYVLCISCADRLDPPRGWLLDDRRSEPPLFVPHPLDERHVARPDETTVEVETATVRRQLFFGHSGF